MYSIFLFQNLKSTLSSGSGFNCEGEGPGTPFLCHFVHYSSLPTCSALFPDTCLSPLPHRILLLGTRLLEFIPILLPVSEKTKCFPV